MRGARSAKLIARAFDRLAGEFDRYSFLHDRIREGLLDRLELTALQPGRILDAGCATGRSSELLQSRYKKSHVIGLDLSFSMATACNRRNRFWKSKISPVVGDYQSIPFENGCFDLVFANLSPAYSADLSVFFAEVSRVLRTGGLFAFSTLGPDTLQEFRQAITACGVDAPQWPFLDMHVVGDLLVHSRLRDPVLDVEALDIEYSAGEKLISELRATGAVPPWAAGSGYLGLRPDRLLQHYPGASEGLPLKVRVEAVYGHAWGSGPAGETAVPISEIKRS